MINVHYTVYTSRNWVRMYPYGTRCQAHLLVVVAAHLKVLKWQDNLFSNTHYTDYGDISWNIYLISMNRGRYWLTHAVDNTNEVILDLGSRNSTLQLRRWARPHHTGHCCSPPSTSQSRSYFSVACSVTSVNLLSFIPSGGIFGVLSSY